MKRLASIRPPHAAAALAHLVHAHGLLLREPPRHTDAKKHLFLAIKALGVEPAGPPPLTGGMKTPAAETALTSTAEPTSGGVY